MAHPWKWSVAAAALVLFGPAAALAQDTAEAEPAGAGFGERDAFVLTIERTFGFLSQSFGDGDDDDDKETYDSVGMFPPYWGDIGLFQVTASGLTYGTLIGYSRLSQDEAHTSIARLKPRLGYAMSKNETLGLWLRAGPSLLYATYGDDDNDSSAYLVAASAEAYAVITPVEHVGLLLGPVIDVNLIGRDDDDNSISYSSFGLMAGLFGEF